MIFVKSFLAGLIALILAVLLGIGALVAIAEMSSREGTGVIVGGFGWPIVAGSLPAFAGGFFWQYRRTRRLHVGA